MDELVDIVNENNQVVGQALKSDAHQQGLLHRTIIAELIDSNGKWTLVKQAGDKQDPGQFVSPVGGHIQAGESEVDALIREASEEIGLDLKPHIKKNSYTIKRIGQSIYNRQVNGRIENHYFILYEIHTDHIPILNHESISFEKFSPNELSKQLTANPNAFGAAFHFVRQFFYH